MKHIKNLTNNSQGLINWLQTHYNGGEGVVMIADCISGSREATNTNKPLGVEYITANTFPYKCMLPKKTL